MSSEYAVLERRISNLEGEQRLTRSALNDLGKRCGELPDKAMDDITQHQEKWDEAMKDIDSPRLFARKPEEDTISFCDPDAAFVEQVEVSLNEDMVYVTQLRFDDDTTEVLSTHTLRATAMDFATKQARRYRIAIFDTSYEKLVD